MKLWQKLKRYFGFGTASTPADSLEWEEVQRQIRQQRRIVGGRY